MGMADGGWRCSCSFEVHRFLFWFISPLHLLEEFVGRMRASSEFVLSHPMSDAARSHPAESKGCHVTKFLLFLRCRPCAMKPTLHPTNGSQCETFASEAVGTLGATKRFFAMISPTSISREVSLKEQEQRGGLPWASSDQLPLSPATAKPLLP